MIQKYFLLFFVVMPVMVYAQETNYYDRASLGIDKSIDITAEQEALLSSMVKNANSNCISNAQDLFVTIDLIVDEPFPTTGIPVTAIYRVFLTKQGVKRSAIKESQATIAELNAKPEYIDLKPILVSGSIEVEFKCTKK